MHRPLFKHNTLLNTLARPETSTTSHTVSTTPLSIQHTAALLSTLSSPFVVGWWMQVYVLILCLHDCTWYVCHAGSCLPPDGGFRCPLGRMHCHFVCHFIGLCECSDATVFLASCIAFAGTHSQAIHLASSSVDTSADRAAT